MSDTPKQDESQAASGPGPQPDASTAEVVEAPNVKPPYFEPLGPDERPDPNRNTFGHPYGS